MWRSRGRSGVGDSFTGEAYEDIEGLTPNGRQWINPLTKETRNLSGANYWHLRKSLNSDEVVKPDVWTADGKANIAAFSDEALGLNQKKTPAKREIPIAHKIVPQERTLNRLDEQQKELYKAFEEEKISEEEFKNLIYALEVKRSRAWKARCKALGVPEEYSEEMEEGNIASEWDDLPYLVGKNSSESGDWWRNGNVFVLGWERIKEGLNSLRNKKVRFSVDKQKAAPYVGFIVIAFSLWVIF